MNLLVVLMICNISQPCDQQHARSYKAYHSQPGQIVCGLPSVEDYPRFASDMASDEYLVVKCRNQK